MKRRDLFVGTGAAVGLMSIPFSSYMVKNGPLNVGVMKQVFSLSGYDETRGLDNLIYHTKFKTAYADLLDGKLDVLISSPQLLTSFESEFNLLSFSNSANNEAWAQVGLDVSQKFHANNGLKAESLGVLSDIKLRLSNKSAADLESANIFGTAGSVFASGVDIVAFEKLGFTVHSSEFHKRLSAQLADLIFCNIDLTGAYAPALFLQGLHHTYVNLNISPSDKTRPTFIFNDPVSRASTSVEMLYRPDLAQQGSLDKIKAGLSSIIAQDTAYQTTALSAIQNLVGYQHSGVMPERIVSAIQKYQNLYSESVAKESRFGLADSFKKIRGISV